MRARDYIQAVRQLLREGHDPEAVFHELKAVLARKGHEKLHAQILRGVAMQIEKDMQGTKAIVTLARTEDSTKEKHAIAAALETLGSTSDHETVIDPTIIGGFVLRQGGKMLDTSYKKQLLTLYRSLIG